MHLQAEFNFKASRAAQRLKIQRLQHLFAGLIALFIYSVVNDAIVTGLLELTLLLVLLRARQALTLFTAVECLVVKNKSAAASINGQHHPLSAYGLDYFSSYLALVSLTTVAGQTYRCFVSPGLFGAAKYRQLLALLKAAPTAAAQRLA